MCSSLLAARGITAFSHPGKLARYAGGQPVGSAAWPPWTPDELRALA